MVQDLGWLAVSTIVLCTIVAVGAGTACGAEDVRVDIHWEQFLARSDPSWEVMPSSWADAPFIGNGWIGSYCYQAESVEGPALNFVISRTDVYDHRKSTAFPFSIARARLPNGRFKLRYAGAEPEGTMRLDLWNAEVESTVETSVGKLSLRAFTHATRNVIVIETEASGGGAEVRLALVSGHRGQPPTFELAGTQAHQAFR